MRAFVNVTLRYLNVVMLKKAYSCFNSSMYERSVATFHLHQGWQTFGYHGRTGSIGLDHCMQSINIVDSNRNYIPLTPVLLVFT